MYSSSERRLQESIFPLLLRFGYPDRPFHIEVMRRGNLILRISEISGYAKALLDPHLYLNEGVL
jgi:hypothetical protein